MTQPWLFESDGLDADDFAKVQRLMRHAARRMSEPQILALADGLYEICLQRRELAGITTPRPQGPRRRWTDRALMLRPGGLGRPFSEILDEAIKAAERDKERGVSPDRRGQSIAKR